jgi:hypothetical protein
LGLFENYVVATYSDRLSEYFMVAQPQGEGSRLDADRATVTSEFNRGSGLSQAGAISVDWRLTRRDGSYRVRDIIIDRLAINGQSRRAAHASAPPDTTRGSARPEILLALLVVACAANGRKRSRAVLPIGYHGTKYMICTTRRSAQRAQVPTIQRRSDQPIMGQP